MTHVLTPADRPAETSVLLNLLPHALQTLRREPALGITVCYLLVAMAGIFYNYSFYRRFDIPVLTLSQISDFLVAGIQQPMALLLVFTTFPICWLIDRINVYSRRHRAARRGLLLQDPQPSYLRRIRIALLFSTPRWVTGCFYLLAIVYYGWMFVFAYAEHRAEMVRNGEAPQVSVWLTGDSNALATSSKTWSYLGAVANYVFVYDNANHRSVIMPVNNIVRIEPVASEQKPSPAVVVAPIP